MKTLLIYSTFALLFLTACSSAKTTPETISEIARKVESKDYTVTVHYANPLRMKSVVLTSIPKFPASFSITLINDVYAGFPKFFN